MATTASAEKRRLCLNCDNRHGCRSAQPTCLILRPTAAERPLSGQQLMFRRGLLGQCAACELFRRCWNSEAYRRQLLRRPRPAKDGDRG